MVQERDDVVPIDAAVLTNPKVWEASGHLAAFTDPLVDCRNCKERWRADQIGDTCPNCGSKDLTEARPFNLMFKTFVGPVEDSAAAAYLRPETAQGMFVNFLNVLQTTRKKPPFGIAQTRPGVPQRDHAGQLRLPDPRVRDDGDGVLRTAGGGPEVVRVLVRRAARLVPAGTASRPTCCACASTKPTSCRITRRARRTSSSSTRGAGESSKASPTARTSTCGPTPSTPARSSSTSIRPPASTTCRTSSSRRPASPAR